jgi:hypothetical protein
MGMPAAIGYGDPTQRALQAVSTQDRAMKALLGMQEKEMAGADREAGQATSDEAQRKRAELQSRKGMADQALQQNLAQCDGYAGATEANACRQRARAYHAQVLNELMGGV